MAPAALLALRQHAAPRNAALRLSQRRLWLRHGEALRFSNPDNAGRSDEAGIAGELPQRWERDGAAPWGDVTWTRHEQPALQLSGQMMSPMSAALRAAAAEQKRTGRAAP